VHDRLPSIIHRPYNDTVQANPDALIHLLGQAGHRITQPRKAVIEALCRARRSLDANELLERAKKIHAGVGLATVYRTLDMLEAIGVVRKVQLDGSYHVVACEDHSLHYHLICEKCHSVTELAVDPPALEKIAHQRGFTVKPAPIEVMGLCDDCK
jgi:Fe2+ or Zn2+ uptake regulation protein